MPDPVTLDEKALEAGWRAVVEGHDYRTSSRDAFVDGLTAYLASLPPARPAEPTSEAVDAAIDRFRNACMSEDGEDCDAAERALRALYAAPAPLCACLHPHASGSDGEDLGCAVCDCQRFIPAAPLPSGEPTSEAVACCPRCGEACVRCGVMPLPYDERLLALGSRLAELLDEDHWREVERMLHDLAHPLPSDAPSGDTKVDADTRRVDWLEQYGKGLFLDPTKGWSCSTPDGDEMVGSTVREVIDDAMETK